ncbi:MAG: hypothetical protein JNL70_24755 [Saprospiraceae bacterium]|nr:hypothetical protein [Saprospiraceae bacterium]
MRKNLKYSSRGVDSTNQGEVGGRCGYKPVVAHATSGLRCRLFCGVFATCFADDAMDGEVVAPVA